jgi:protein NEDD1
MMATRAIETAVDVPKSPREKVLSPVRDPLGNAGTSSASGAHGSDRVSENAYAVAKTKEENKKVAEPERKVDLHSLDTDCDSNSDIRPTNVNLGIGIEAEAESISTAVRGGRKAKMQAEAAYDARDQSLRGGGRRARSRAESYSSTRSGAKSSASVCSGLRIIRGESESARELVRVRERERAPAVSDTRATEGGGQQVFGERISRTPSPDLPAIDRDVDTPVPKEKKVAAAGTRMGIGVLGLGTPEVERWLEAGMGRDVGEGTEREGRKVGFKDTSDGEGQGENEASDNEEERERERSMSLQISPRRSGPASSDPTPAPASAHDLLRTIVRDVMYDMQSETRAGLTGLHLDLLRMGRGWRKEVRGVMEECGYGAGGELERLREENRRLREENERLKRRLA